MGPALGVPPVHRETGSAQYTHGDRLWTHRAGGLGTRRDEETWGQQAPLYHLAVPGRCLKGQERACLHHNYELPRASKGPRTYVFAEGKLDLELREPGRSPGRVTDAGTRGRLVPSLP